MSKGGFSVWKKTIFSIFVLIFFVGISSVGYANPLNNKTTTIIKTVETDTTDKQVEKSDKIENVELTEKKDKIEKKPDKTKYHLTKPEKNSYSTENKIAFIHGRAPSGTSITIEVYGTTDLTRKGFDLLNLPEEVDYIEIFTETIKSGNMGLFDKQLNLISGINKIIINYGVEGIDPEIIIIYVIESIPLTLPTIFPQQINLLR